MFNVQRRNKLENRFLLKARLLVAYVHGLKENNRSFLRQTEDDYCDTKQLQRAQQYSIMKQKNIQWLCNIASNSIYNLTVRFHQQDLDDTWCTTSYVTSFRLALPSTCRRRTEQSEEKLKMYLVHLRLSFNLSLGLANKAMNISNQMTIFACKESCAASRRVQWCRQGWSLKVKVLALKVKAWTFEVKAKAIGP